MDSKLQRWLILCLPSPVFRLMSSSLDYQVDPSRSQFSLSRNSRASGLMNLPFVFGLKRCSKGFMWPVLTLFNVKCDVQEDWCRGIASCNWCLCFWFRGFLVDVVLIDFEIW